MALEDVAATAKPDTILGWYRRLIAKKFDGSKMRRSVRRPKIDHETERLVLQMARENPSWGYDRIVGALADLGHRLSDQTVGNALRRHGISPAPKRKRSVSRANFIRSYRGVLVGMGRASPHKGDLDEMDQRAYRTRIGHLQPGQLLPQPQAGPCRTGAVRRDSVFSGVQATNRTAKENQGLFTSVCDILLYPLPAC